jgi:hypothetical protein
VTIGCNFEKVSKPQKKTIPASFGLNQLIGFRQKKFKLFLVEIDIVVIIKAKVGKSFSFPLNPLYISKWNYCSNFSSFDQR